MHTVRTYPLVPHPGVVAAAQRSATHWPQYLASPLHGPTAAEFSRTADWLYAADPAGARPLILDSGCGTGRSTRSLALAHPDCAVVGVDRSELRLGRTAPPLPPNARLVRAELASWWRLMLRSDAGPLAADRLRAHYLLYPNPYPKAARLNRRWHAHPVLPALLALGGSLELRSNWRVYLEEFELALGALADADASGDAARRLALPSGAGQPGTRAPGPRGSRVAEYRLRAPEDALSLFELKYSGGGEQLWRLVLPG